MKRGLAALRLLVIDDNPQMRSIIGTALLAAGVGHLHYAGDGRRGLRALAEFRPDLVFVDYEMPVMNGLEFISTVRSMPPGACYLPIIMVTGHADLPRLIEARDRGVTEFLSKPISARSLLRRLETAIFNPRSFIKARDFHGPDRRRRADGSYGGPLRRSSDCEATVEI